MTITRKISIGILVIVVLAALGWGFVIQKEKNKIDKDGHYKELSVSDQMKNFNALETQAKTLKDAAQVRLASDEKVMAEDIKQAKTVHTATQATVTSRENTIKRAGNPPSIAPRFSTF